MPEIVPSSVLRAIEDGLCFLKKTQLSSGNFKTVQSRSRILERGVYRKSPFITSVVLHSLTALQYRFDTDNMIKKGIGYLLSECETPGIWRFFGKGSNMSPDLDDTCCALAVLKEYQIPGVDFLSIAQHLMQFRDRSGVFYTWLRASSEDNDIDPVVNSNALFFYALIDIELRGVKVYLVDVLRKLIVSGGVFRSSYYLASASLLYSISKVIAFQKSIESRAPDNIEITAKELMSRVPKKNNVLDAALILTSSLNLGVLDENQGARLLSIMRQQSSDGSWKAVPFFKEGYGIDIFYGSSELTTALCIEALAKFYTHAIANHEFAILP